MNMILNAMKKLGEVDELRQYSLTAARAERLKIIDRLNEVDGERGRLVCLAASRMEAAIDNLNRSPRAYTYKHRFEDAQFCIEDAVYCARKAKNTDPSVPRIC